MYLLAKDREKTIGEGGWRVFFQSWRKTIAFLAVLFSVILLLSWSDLRINQQPFAQWLQNIALQLVSPVQQRLEQSFVWMRENISTVQELGSLREQNIRLREENDELTKLALQLSDLREENKRLSELLEYKSSLSEGLMDSTVARIIGWPSHWSPRYTLDGGENLGFRRDMVVITPRGVVGKLINVWSNGSTLMLLQDELSSVIGRVNGYLGIVRGRGSQDPTLRMSNISIDADIQPGDQVMTAGLGGIYPADLLIGTVISIEPDSSGFYKNAILQMAVDSYRLYEVLVIEALQEIVEPEEPIEGEDAGMVEP